MTQDLYIDSAAGLEQLCVVLRRHPWLTLDTEFIREKTYRPRLCLIQVANPEVVACIDPIALGNLGPLLDLLYEPTITKVLHAARQDLEIFHELRGALPQPIFDTQIAATLLGQGDQIGYAALVQEELGISLDKGHTRTDWCQRPLDAGQIGYAADDVRHLREVYLRQQQRLEALGRLGWLEEDFIALTDPQLYTNPPELAWQRIKGANRLKGVQLAVLQQLAAWREERAQQLDKPRRWIVGDDQLLDMARLMPLEPAQLDRLRGLEEGSKRRYGEEWFKLIAQAKQIPREQWPSLREGPRLQSVQEPVVDALMALLRHCCEMAQVTPSAVASRRDLERLVLGDGEVALLHGWRAAIAGHQLAAFLRGESVLTVAQGELAVAPRT
ncbi:MAG TPA: ribonuclease D [Gammaproteobacteria bacterium]